MILKISEEYLQYIWYRRNFQMPPLELVRQGHIHTLNYQQQSSEIFKSSGIHSRRRNKAFPIILIALLLLKLWKFHLHYQYVKERYVKKKLITPGEFDLSIQVKDEHKSVKKVFIEGYKTCCFYLILHTHHFLKFRALPADKQLFTKPVCSTSWYQY